MTAHSPPESHVESVETTRRNSALEWAVAKQAPLSICLLPDGQWHGLKSTILRFDGGEKLLQIVYPIYAEKGAPPEIVTGQELGISFRRGHKKCLFVAPVVVRRQDSGTDGQAVDTLVLRAPNQIREMQRRLYQRVIVPPERLVPVKLWQGGVPKAQRQTWPICAGRVSNVSVGGVFVEVRADQNPRLAVGEAVGVEITAKPNEHPILVDSQYRHCMLISSERLGLGLQFVGLEQDCPGRATLTQIAEFVKELRRTQTQG